MSSIVGGGVSQMITVDYRGKGGVWNRPKYDHTILEQPLSILSSSQNATPKQMIWIPSLLKAKATAEQGHLEFHKPKIDIKPNPIIAKKKYWSGISLCY